MGHGVGAAEGPDPLRRPTKMHGTIYHRCMALKGTMPTMLHSSSVILMPIKYNEIIIRRENAMILCIAIVYDKTFGRSVSANRGMTNVNHDFVTCLLWCDPQRSRMNHTWHRDVV
jgi:hypothetical protein